jgi:hypothetical protein
MNIGNIGKALANQALESTKNSVLDAVRVPEPGKPAEANSAAGRATTSPDDGAVILGQIQAMQRPLKEDQELLVQLRAGGETLRVREIFVPTSHVLVFAGVDAEGHVTRIITPASAAQIVCKIVPVTPGATPVRVNVLTPKPQPKPAA